MPPARVIAWVCTAVLLVAAVVALKILYTAWPESYAVRDVLYHGAWLAVLAAFATAGWAIRPTMRWKGPLAGVLAYFVIGLVAFLVGTPEYQGTSHAPLLWTWPARWLTEHGHYAGLWQEFET